MHIFRHSQQLQAFLVLDTRLCDECVFFVENQGRKKRGGEEKKRVWRKSTEKLKFFS